MQCVRVEAAVYKYTCKSLQTGAFVQRLSIPANNIVNGYGGKRESSALSSVSFHFAFANRGFSFALRHAFQQLFVATCAFTSFFFFIAINSLIH